ncbi:putative protein kinase RLK-Pelle-LRR-III family [Helianthus annuus]|nr:putative protein kinase RLK-Pelle-LRR-III family [Helianthus annuus]
MFMFMFMLTLTSNNMNGNTHLLLSFLVVVIVNTCFGLTTDGILLLAFKYSVLNDPLRVLDTWNYSDQSPCSWNGVVCTSNRRVTELSLPNSKLVASIPANIGLIKHLSKLDLSNNSINGSIPLSLYNATNYILKKRRRVASDNKHKHENEGNEEPKEYDWASSSEDHERKCLRSWPCLTRVKDKEDTDESSIESIGSENEETIVTQDSKYENSMRKEPEKKGELVTVDGSGKELELEPLLKASAYILGATGSSIIYKAVLEDGTALAVRRIGESGLERFRDFENQVRVIAKLVHPNLVRIRGFYWGVDEKLVIYDYVPHGSLANARYRKVGSSPCPLPWEMRLKIAKGTARGLMYIHDKKQVHGNLKPSNILLGSDMEPKIGDFGLERLVVGEYSCKVGGSSRNFGSKRSTASRDSFQDVTLGSNPSPSPSAMGCISPYYAPESLRSIKPNAKWDVFSYGVVLLELLTGKVIVSDEFGPASMTWSSTLTDEEKNKVLRMAEVSIRGDMEGKEEALFAILKLGYNCISSVPQKRPHMKEVLHTLDKFPCASSSSSWSHINY